MNKYYRKLSEFKFVRYVEGYEQGSYTNRLEARWRGAIVPESSLRSLRNSSRFEELV